MNTQLRTRLEAKVALFFDEGLCLRESEERPQVNKYGPHPNAEGCAVWARELFRAVKEKALL